MTVGKQVGHIVTIWPVFLFCVYESHFSQRNLSRYSICSISNSTNISLLNQQTIQSSFIIQYSMAGLNQQSVSNSCIRDIAKVTHQVNERISQVRFCQVTRRSYWYDCEISIIPLSCQVKKVDITKGKESHYNMESFSIGLGEAVYSVMSSTSHPALQSNVSGYDLGQFGRLFCVAQTSGMRLVP